MTARQHEAPDCAGRNGVREPITIASGRSLLGSCHPYQPYSNDVTEGYARLITELLRVERHIHEGEIDEAHHVAKRALQAPFAAIARATGAA